MEQKHCSICRFNSICFINGCKYECGCDSCCCVNANECCN